MAINKAVVALARSLWIELKPEFDRQIQVLHVALEKADTIETVRLLQGRLLGYREFLGLPQRLETLLDHDEKETK